MNFLYILFTCFLAFALYRLFKYVVFRLGYKDSKYPIVQRVERKPKPKDTTEAFLPGSRMGMPELDEAMVQQMKVQKLQKDKKKKGGLPFGKKELKNAILLEDLLHPKYKEDEQKHHGGGSLPGNQGH